MHRSPTIKIEGMFSKLRNIKFDFAHCKLVNNKCLKD